VSTTRQLRYEMRGRRSIHNRADFAAGLGMQLCQPTSNRTLARIRAPTGTTQEFGSAHDLDAVIRETPSTFFNSLPTRMWTRLSDDCQLASPTGRFRSGWSFSSTETTGNDGILLLFNHPTPKRPLRPVSGAEQLKISWVEADRCQGLSTRRNSRS
jgi:hypothetical protein